MTKKNITIDKKKLSREAIAVAIDGKTLPIEINSSIILTKSHTRIASLQRVIHA